MIMMCYAAALPLQLLRQQQRQAVVILNNHYVGLLLLVGIQPDRIIFMAAPRGIQYREAEPHRGAFPFFRFNTDGALLLLNDLLADGQPQAGSADPLGGAVIHSSELLEQLADLILRNAESMILNLYDNPFTLVIQ
ncbi:hypothetical protein D3C75_356790 [compost metagenome]